MNQSSVPKIDFPTFLLSIASAACMGLGIKPPGTPKGEEPKVNLELARQNIDLLDLIQEKTKGNRSADEDKLLEQLLFETRMLFVEVQKKTGK
ncbi:MAG: hypothetical protein A2583_02065 [Bdellovibrionales bacterium RIFOXYD1_FULL_53_11]|nr:MAG: hypothetical protein A2583_02065 [Bdellovibrionales bacterium RIFOXYD1_FULL_53_11]